MKKYFQVFFLTQFCLCNLVAYTQSESINFKLKFVLTGKNWQDYSTCSELLTWKHEILPSYLQGYLLLLLILNNISCLHKFQTDMITQLNNCLIEKFNLFLLTWIWQDVLMVRMPDFVRICWFGKQTFFFIIYIQWIGIKPNFFKISHLEGFGSFR